METNNFFFNFYFVRCHRLLFFSLRLTLALSFSKYLEVIILYYTYRFSLPDAFVVLSNQTNLFISPLIKVFKSPQINNLITKLYAREGTWCPLNLSISYLTHSLKTSKKYQIKGLVVILLNLRTYSLPTFLCSFSLKEVISLISLTFFKENNDAEENTWPGL